jgi:DNA replication protein DnaC
MRTGMRSGTVVNVLRREKYLGEKYTPEQLSKALEKYRADHPYLPPLHPSKLDPSREAECELCLDLEWIATASKDANGKETITGYRPCICGEKQRKAEVARRILENSGIPGTSGRAFTFKTFKVVPGAEKAHEAALMMATQEAPFKILLITGNVGCGKTHLLYAAAEQLADHGVNVKFIRFPDLLSEARINMGNQMGGIDVVINKYKKVPFLCLDEVKFKLNKKGEIDDEWPVNAFEDILNYRYSNELDTIITTNHDISAFPTPIISRFSEGRVCRHVLNSAPDYRPRVKK